MKKEIIQATEMSADDKIGLALSNMSSFCWDGSYPFDTNQSLQQITLADIYACVLSNRVVESVSINSRLYDDKDTGRTLIG